VWLETCTHSLDCKECVKSRKENELAPLGHSNHSAYGREHHGGEQAMSQFDQVVAGSCASEAVGDRYRRMNTQAILRATDTSPSVDKMAKMFTALRTATGSERKSR